MYVNFKLVKEKGMSLTEFLFLIVLKQASISDVSEILDELNNKLGVSTNFITAEYVKHIKGNKSDNAFTKMRLSEKGKKLLEDIQTADVEEWHITLADWIKQVYEAEGKKIGNKKRLTRGLAQFAMETGITHRNLALLWKAFLHDAEEMKFSNIAENVIFTSKNTYQRKFSIDECRLWDYYKKNKETFQKVFE
jgi:DNA-binding MarR family transcriptional regulator